MGADSGWTMKLSDWLIVAATVLGPILAVQAQKWVERWRERQQRKSWVFATLMATRGARTSPDHVRALNTIELAFYGTKLAFRQWHSAAEKTVLSSWREYHAHLYNDPKMPQFPNAEAYQAAVSKWQAKGEELFVNMLEAMAKATGYAMTREQVRTGHYLPIAMTTIDQEQAVVRRALIDVLTGKQNLGMDVKSVPFPKDPQGGG